MTMKKDDTILISVKRKFIKSSGLHTWSALHLTGYNKDSEQVVITEKFESTDEFGNVWIKILWNKSDYYLMIPHKYIIAIVTKPSGDIENIFGFKPPANHTPVE